ncbi:PA2169 family four-helix-bundle protein [Ramlibacter sp.]|uniref:ferritin-like domain-containing protein n=1 Tax=Ramlibacter sp. TaxID=1917967 RepID=UPI0017DEF6F2|nr:PA2169 family four-helix-bundle protein [Ramlibacter sp.]MBA2675899.1 PA2169 family four-helix-bundle protein [Ramlibacter sp.]
MAAEEREERDLNRDPITDEPGAHPVGTGVGAAGGAMAGAAAGAIAGPVGMAIGGVIGAVVGGLAGKAAAEAVNPTAEETHWRENYTKEPYYQNGRSFDDYGPAYRLGVNGRTQSPDEWTTVEPRLASEWESTRGNSTLNWNDASPAARAAWDRVDVQVRDYDDNFNGDLAPTNTGANAGTSPGGSNMPLASDAGNTLRGDMNVRDSTLGTGSTSGMGGTGTTGAAAAVGAMQAAGDNSGDRDDVVDVLQDLVECSKDGEYGFRACAEQAERADLKSLFLQRADGCRSGAQELNSLISQLGGTTEDGGSAMGAMHRGWVAVKTTLTSYDDKAVLEEAERGEDNAKARYRKAAQKPLPDNVRQVVERQLQAVERNHDQIKQMRNQLGNA